MMKTKRGFYTPKNPDKWIFSKNGLSGTRVEYRSSWERRFMVWADHNPKVIEINSEGVIIPYRSPIDNKMHRYYMDFYIKYIDKDDNVVKKLIEIKPLKETMPPKKTKSKYYNKQVKTYLVNKAKWDATLKVCEKTPDLSFQIITERELGL